MLYIVSTPIGNLEDITYRAVRILGEVDYIACEDTRTTKVLLNHYDIKTPTISYHSHSGLAKVDKIIDMLKNGKQVALVSDAGTPGISDPGYPLIKEVINNGFDISPIPGASALLASLVSSGMMMNHFSYYGFLPVKKGRQTMLTNLQNKEHTAIIYESVHRIEKTLTDLETYFGETHHIVVAREITKKFEDFIRGDIKEVKNYFEENKSKIKGEFVIIF